MGKTTKPKTAVTGNYEVGHGKPPKKHQFQPGEVHNRRGRPRRSDLTLVEVLRKVLAEKGTIEINGETLRKTNAAIIAMALREKALAGDKTARRLLMRLYRDFDRELTEEQNQAKSGVYHEGDDREEVEAQVFEELRRSDPDGDEAEARQTARQIALERTMVKPEPIAPLRPIRRRRGARL